jgi:predicted permease
VRAALGRTIQPDDDRPGGAASVAMVSHRFWQRAYGGDPSVTQQTIALNGQMFAIVGVLPARFFGMDASVMPDVIVPIHAIEIATATVNPLQNRIIWAVCRVVGRLNATVSEDRARTDVEQWLHADLATAPPEGPYDPPRIWLLDGSRGLGTLRDAASTPLVVLLAVVGALMLAACANIAGLLLARGNARQKELATRLALGAPRSRVVRQLITESLVLSSAGGLLGLGFAYGLSGLGPTLLSGFMPTLFGADRALNVTPALDARVLLFSIGAALLSGLIFGVVPAFRATRLNLIATIRQTAAGHASRRTFLSGGQAMVAAQTALAVLLLVSAGLLLRTVINLRASDLGFTAEGLLYARVEPRSGGLPRDQRQRFFEDVTRRVERLPGVMAASATMVAPMGGDSQAGVGSATIMLCTPESAATGVPPQPSAYNGVLPGFFDTLGVSFVSGRDFTWAENGLQPGNRNVAIVNEAFARRFFPEKDALGESFFGFFGGQCRPQDLTRIIVGIVADTRNGLRGDPLPMAYMPLSDTGTPVTLVLRTASDPAAMIPVVRRAVKEVNASIPTFSEAPLLDLRERSLRRERLLSDLLALFGTVTVIVCCLGIYGTLAYSITRRRSEISIRMAIGARARDVITMFIRESLLPVTVGIAVGCGATLALTRWLESLLFGVSGHDPLTIVAAAALFLLVATLAAAIPARAAARVDPVLALRQ